MIKNISDNNNHITYKLIIKQYKELNVMRYI